MKKVFLLLTLIATTYSAWGAYSYNNMWIMGTGTQGSSWVTGLLKLNNSGETPPTTFTYTGYFYVPSSSYDGFKMPVNSSNVDVCIRPKGGHKAVDRGASYDLQVSSSQPTSTDYKFRVKKEGWYTFTINQSTEKFIVAQDSFPSTIYPLGDGTSYGWKYTKPMYQTSAGSGQYEDYVDFAACTNKSMKFACMDNNDKSLIGPVTNDTIKGPGTYAAKPYNAYSGTGTSPNYSQNDKKFVVTLGSAVTYFVRVQLSNTSNNVTVTIKQKPTFSITTTAVTGKVGSTITRAIETNSGGTKKYSSSDTKVATVDVNGNVTFVGAGTATITAKVEESTTFGPMSASYMVTVERYLPELAFAEASKTVCKNAAAFINPLQNKGNGAVTYESSDPSVAEVAANGTITIKKAGEQPITITANSAQTNQYSSGSTSFTLTVTDNLTPSPLAPVDITETKEVKSITQDYGWSSEVCQTNIAYNGALQLTASNNNAKTVTQYRYLRYYQNNNKGELILTAKPQKAVIKSAVFTYTTDNAGTLTKNYGTDGKNVPTEYRITTGSTYIANANTFSLYTGATTNETGKSLNVSAFSVVYTDPTIVFERLQSYTSGTGNKNIDGDNQLYKWTVNAQNHSEDVGAYKGIKLQSTNSIAMRENPEGGIKSVSFDYRVMGTSAIGFNVSAGSTTHNFTHAAADQAGRIFTYTHDFNATSNVALTIAKVSDKSDIAIGPMHITPYLLFNVANHTASFDVKDGTTCDLNSALINNTGENTHTFSIIENTAGGYPTITNGILDFSSVTESGYIKVQAKWGDVTTTLKLNITPLPKQVLSFAESSKSVTVGAISSFTNTLTHSTGDGAISYESSNPSVASVASNGEVTIHAVGAAMIIAKAAKTANYQAAELSYPVTVSRVAHAIPLADITETKLVLDLSADNSWIENQNYPNISLNNAIMIKAYNVANNKVVNSSKNALRYYQNIGQGKFTISGKSGVTVKSIYLDQSGSWNDGVAALEYINNGVNVPSEKRFPNKQVTPVNVDSITLYAGSTKLGRTDGRVDINEFSIVYNDPSIVFEQLQGYTSGISADVTGDNGLYKWSVNGVDRTTSVGEYKGVKIANGNSIAMNSNQEGGIKSVSFDYKVLGTDAIGFDVKAGDATDNYTHAAVAEGRVLTYTHDFDANSNTALSITMGSGSAIAVGPMHITPYLLFNVANHAATINLTSAADAKTIDLMPLLINNTDATPSFTMLEYTTGGTPSVSDAGVVDFSTVTKTGTIKVRANVGNVSTTLTLNINLLDPQATFAEDAVTKYTTAGSYKQELDKGSSTGKVTYSLTSAPPGAAINETTGEVTISTTAGTYTVQGKLAAALPYAEDEATYTLTVTEPPVPTTNFAPTTVNKNQLDDPFTNTLNTESDGTKHFSSTDTRVATVDESTGLVTMGEKPGTTKIKVVIDATDSWKQGNAEYTLNVSGAPVADAHVLTISTDDLQKKHGFVNDKNYTNIALNDVLTLNKGKYYTDDGGVLRYYQKYDDPTSFTIQAKAGVIIQTVKFTYISRNEGTLAKKSGTNIGTSDRYVSGTTYPVDANSFTCYYGNKGAGDNGRADIQVFEIKYFDPSQGVAVTKTANDLAKDLGLAPGGDGYKDIKFNQALALHADQSGTLKYFSSATTGNFNCYRWTGPIYINARPGAKIHHVKITYETSDNAVLSKYATGLNIPAIDQIASDSIIYVNANSLRLNIGSSTNTGGTLCIKKIYVNYSDTTSVTETFETTPAAGWTLSNCTTGNERIYYDQAVKLNTTNGKISTTVAEGGIKDLSFDWSPVSTGKKVDFKVNCNGSTDAITQASYDKNYVFSYAKTGVKSNNVSFSIEQQSTSATELKVSRIAITPYLLYTEKEADITVCSSYKNANLIDNRDNATAIVYSVINGSDYASVNTSTGEVTGLKAGTATIQAAWDGVTTTYQLTVSTESSITLDEEKDNSLLIAGYDGVENMNVTLIRKLSAGKYNTFCVPFAIGKEALATALETEITKLVTLDESQPGALEEEGGQMNLNIAMKEAETIEAGKPYLIEVADNVNDPINISGVTIVNVGENNYFQSKDEKVKFYGITSKYLIPNDNHYLFMSNNRLSWNNSGAAAYMKGLRSYFHATVADPAKVSARLVFNQPDTPTELMHNAQCTMQGVQKVIINNQLIIIREGAYYNAHGQMLKVVK